MNHKKSEKQVQIPFSLFMQIYNYFNAEDSDISENAFKDIQKGVNDRFEAMYRRYLYTQSKTANTDEERDKFRNAYLDEIGMRDSFRWS